MPARHPEEHIYDSAFITDIVIGMSDGLTVPFALAAGLSSIVGSNTIILTAGLVEIAAGSIAMGLGGYLSRRAHIKQNPAGRKREDRETGTIPEVEKQELKAVFAGLGLSRETQDIIAEEMSKDREQWIDFMIKYEPESAKPDPEQARKSAWNIAISYIAGGLIPLAPYFFSGHPAEGLKWSCLITLCCLFIFGFMKARVTGQPAFAGALRVTLTGAAAAGAAFLIAGVFK